MPYKSNPNPKTNQWETKSKPLKSLILFRFSSCFSRTSSTKHKPDPKISKSTPKNKSIKDEIKTQKIQSTKARFPSFIQPFSSNSQPIHEQNSNPNPKT